MVKLPASQIRLGDLLDLEDDPYFTGDFARIWEFLYGYVVDVEQETTDCVRIGIEGADAYGVPTGHLLTVIEREGDDVTYHLQLPDGTRAELIDRTENGSALVQTAAPVDGFVLVDFDEEDGWARYLVPDTALTIHPTSTGGHQ